MLVLAGRAAHEASSGEQTACIWALGLKHKDPRLFSFRQRKGSSSGKEKEALIRI